MTTLEQRFDLATLTALARQYATAPLRRAGSLTELVIVGVATRLAGQPDQPTAVLWGSCFGIRAAGARITREVVIAREPPFPFDFLATQPILAAIFLQKAHPCIGNVLYQPWSGDAALHWARMRQLATAWLRAGRCTRVLCGQVEPGEHEHFGAWQVLERG